MPSSIAKLVQFGQSPWYDNLTRAHARGGLRELIEKHGIRGVTSNPTIFEKAMAAGTDYDEQIAALVREGRSTREIYWALVEQDITDASALLRPIYDGSHGLDGYVSLEVDPDLAHDTTATLTHVREHFGRLGRPNVMIKIPATREGLPAITDAIDSGVNVNVTLIFALERYEEVIEAYLEGLEMRAARGDDISSVASVASFFVSRVDTEVDRRLPDGHRLRGKAAVANAKLAYQVFLDRFSGPRWADLVTAGARVQRPLWASTSTKNPAYSPTLYVDELIGVDTVNTLAQASIDALVDHPDLRANTILDDVDDARATMVALDEAGIDVHDVTRTLEREGVAAFSASYHDALATLDKKVRELS